MRQKPRSACQLLSASLVRLGLKRRARHPIDGPARARALAPCLPCVPLLLQRGRAPLPLLLGRPGPAGLSSRALSKRSSRKAGPKDRKATPQGAEAAVNPGATRRHGGSEPRPGVLEDYAFKAPKTAIIRVVACAAAGQVCLAMGFAPAFWLKMEFLDVATRGLFIASLLGVSSGLCYAAVKIQRRYVSGVAKSILSKSIAISEVRSGVLHWSP